jgi:HAD superfamily hydrolase (TIGR01509 family)
MERPMNDPFPGAARAALLDFDLTLVDSLPAILRSTNLFADDIGRPRVTAEKILESIGLPLEDTWTEFWGGWDPGWPELYQDRYKEQETRGFFLYPDTLPVLRLLKAAGVKTCVVTNRWLAGLAVANSGIGGLVDAVVGADDVTNVKPDPEPVAKALTLLGVGAGEAVYVGDTVIDMRAGVGAGVRSVGILNGPADREALTAAGAWRVIGALGELPALIGL